MPAAPVRQGTKLGTIVVLLDGKTQATGDAVAAQDVPAQAAAALLQTTKHVGMTLLNGLGVALGFSLGAVLLLAAGGMIYGTAAKSARRRRSSARGARARCGFRRAGSGLTTRS